MKSIIAIALLLAISCNSSKINAKENRDKLNASIELYNKFREQDDNIMSRLSSIVDKIDSNSFTSMDTAGLGSSVNDAKLIKEAGIASLSLYQETDTIINLKAKIEDYLKEAGNFYDNYFPKFISLTKRPKDNDSTTVSKSIAKEMHLLVHKDSLLENAYDSYKAKYDNQN